MNLQQNLLSILVVIPITLYPLWAIEEITSEVCELEVFRARCPYTQHILITTALYGHIRKGKCVHFDLGYFGCYANVDGILDERCGGRQRCEIAMPDGEIKETNPCPTGLGTYLEASYACIPDTVSDISCEGITVRRRLTYITSKQLYQLDCSGENKGYVILRADGDLQIKLTIKTITVEPSNETSTSTYGFLEYRNGENISIPADKQDIDLIIPESNANVWLTQRNAILLIGFQAIGCETLLPPPYTWMQREGSVITIGCDHSQHTWQLHCVGTNWVGSMGNCTEPTVAATKLPQPVESKESRRETEENSLMSREILYALVIGTTLFLSVVVITAGYVFLKRARYEAKAQSHVDSTEMQNMIFTDGNYTNTDSWIRGTTLKPPNTNTNTLQPTLVRPQNGNLTTKSQKYYIVDQDYVNAAGASQA